ncbi:hypothetical protein ACFQX7_06460 [Luedemannella flava]
MSAPVLGFDLTRMGGGPATAEVLLHALRLTAPALAIMAEHLLADDARAELWLEVETAAARMPTVSRGLDPAVTSRDDPTGDPPAPRAGESNAALLRALQLAPIGTVDALLRLVRYDILAWTWSGTGLAASQEPLASQATALLCDAAVAAYLRDVLSPRTRRRLAAPWISAQRRLPELPLLTSDRISWPSRRCSSGCVRSAPPTPSGSPSPPTRPVRGGRGLGRRRPRCLLGRPHLRPDTGGGERPAAARPGPRPRRHHAGRPGRRGVEHAQWCRSGRGCPGSPG